MSGKKVPQSRAGKTDWSRINALSDHDIEEMAQRDQENPATTADDWANAVALVAPRKTVINACFDSDVVEWFKSQGPAINPE